MKLTVRKKLLGAFAAVVGLMIVLAVVALANLGAVGDDVDRVGNGALPRLTLIKGVDAATMDYRGTQLAYVADPAGRNALARQLRGREAEVASEFADFAKLAKDPRDRAYAASSRRHWEQYLATTRAFSRGDTAGALERLAAGKREYTALQADIDRWAADSKADADEQMAAAAATEGSARRTTMLLLGLAVLVAGGLGLVITRGITRSVAVMRRAAAGIAEGDLDQDVEAARAGDYGQGFAVVAEEVRKLAEESQSAAAEVAELVTQIRAKTEQVASVVDESAARTRDGVATVETTREAFGAIGRAVEIMSHRVEGIAASVQQIAGDAQRAERDITGVASVAQDSSASAEQVSASTEQTSASAEEIAASAQSLAATAEDLDKLVRRFRLTA